MNPLISIVVPVFNVEKYLNRCVESLVNQTLSEIEIILVDDGSTDSSAQLCDAWAKKDPRIRVVHKVNGGLSDARNTGAAMARASLIGFVDSDDHVSPNMYQTLYDNMRREKADMAICGMYHCYSNRTLGADAHGCYTLNSKEAIAMCMHGKEISVTAVNRLYPAWLLKEVRFPVGRTTEDGFTVVEFLSRVTKVVVDLSPHYYYEHREGTISTRPYGPSSYDVVDAYDHNKKLIMERYPELQSLAEFRCFWARFIVLDALLTPGAHLDETCLKKVTSYLRENRLSIFKNPYVGRARKIALSALLVDYRIYRLIYIAWRSRYGYKK